MPRVLPPLLLLFALILAAADSPATQPTDPNVDSPEDLAVLKTLDETIRELAAEQQPLEKILSFLRDTTSTGIFVNWSALEPLGIDRNTLISINLRNATFRENLKVILSEASNVGGKGDLAFDVEEGRIIISSHDDLEKPAHRVTRVYNVRDLVSPPANTSTTTQPAAPNLKLAADLQKVLQQSAPDAKLQPASGKLSEFNGLFIIETTPHTHRQIADLLTKIRAADKQPATAPAKK